jgi:uncharacterized repeat protein (TIGR03803 family)
VFKLNAVTQNLVALHTFTSGSDGRYPDAALLDASGILYGETSQGGPNGADGVVFSLDAKSRAFATLHAFTSEADGFEPIGGLVAGASGKLYGTTFLGGIAYGGGTIFEVDPTTGRFATIYYFSGGADGGEPNGVTMGKGGLLFGTTQAGGTGNGTVFEFDPATGKLTTLYSFSGGADGAGVAAGVTIDARGFLYGTTRFGGEGTCVDGYACGTVFRVVP